MGISIGLFLDIFSTKSSRVGTACNCPLNYENEFLPKNVLIMFEKRRLAGEGT